MRFATEQLVPSRRPVQTDFPWWGWCGVVLGLVSWILSWNRFPWLSEWQAHTFTPLWVAFILTVNGLTCRRTGTCVLLRQPRSFLLLFPASAGFWWFFEYLNRFVQNWSYTGADFAPAEYFVFATLSFSTVLPAIASTREWLLSFSWWKRTYEHFLPVRISSPRFFAASALTASGAGLLFLGVYPNQLFSLLWISPLLILVSMQALLREAHIFSPLPAGDWSLVLASALAALALRPVLGNVEFLQPGQVGLPCPFCPAVSPLRDAFAWICGLSSVRIGMQRGGGDGAWDQRERQNIECRTRFTRLRRRQRRPGNFE